MTFKVNPLSKIIGLSGMLALGFLLVVLATALYGSWFPILIGFIFGISHLPFLLTNNSSYDYEAGFGAMDDSLPSEAADVGKFISSLLLTSGVAFPIALCHGHVLTNQASFLSITGGFLIYSTVVIFTTFFDGFSSSPDDPFAP